MGALARADRQRHARDQGPAAAAAARGAAAQPHVHLSLAEPDGLALLHRRRGAGDERARPGRLARRGGGVAVPAAVRGLRSACALAVARREGSVSVSALVDALRAAVGAAHVHVDGDLSAYEVDWRKRYRGRARAVVRPGSTHEVATVVKLCAAHGTAIVPQGGNTGMVGGSIPDESGTQVLMNLGRMNRVHAVDAANLTMTVEAGCILQAAQEAAASLGLLFPLSLAAEGSCTIGGNLATNAGGTQVLRYGNARELCLGLEVVTANGDIWNGLTGLRKDNTGYDLRDLVIGSEGTLGVITAATMKLYPMPVATLTAWAAVPSMEAAVKLLGLAQ
ncbi:MAG: FAD-binding oxidoreductase, partial [Rhizobiales bacterium]|nr:FAD-binding oxidoreductase [Rhizobacter sp.]